MATPELQPLQQLTPEVCLIVEPGPVPQSAFAKLLANAKKVSDLGFAIPALLYTCGFVVLGCYAEESNIGLQAFPTIQFFSAGAGFLIIFVSVVLLVIAIRHFLKRCFEWLSSETRPGKLIRQAMSWILVGSIIAFYLAGTFHLERTRAVALCSFVISMLFSAEGWVRKMAGYYLYFVAFIVGLLVLALYAFSLYPTIPATFGGGKPRHAHVQIDTKAVPGELSRQFGPTVADGNIEAEVYLVTGDSIVIKVLRPEALDKAGSSQTKKPSFMILQLRRSDVSAISWDSRH